jgi:hypothetical protein
MGGHDTLFLGIGLMQAIILAAVVTTLAVLGVLAWWNRKGG